MTPLRALKSERPSFRQLALVVCAATLATALTTASSTVIVGDPAGGYITLLIAPDDSNRIEVTGEFGMGPMSLSGGIFFDSADPSNAFVDTTIWESNKQGVELSANGESQSSTVTFESEGSHYFSSWATCCSTLGAIFFVTGNVSSWNITITKGSLTAMATGQDVGAIWMQDLQAPLHARASQPGARVIIEGSASFTTVAPFYGTFGFGSLGPSWPINERPPVSELTITSGSTTHKCPCTFRPDNTQAGEHALNLTGINEEELVGWFVAPEFPRPK